MSIRLSICNICYVFGVLSVGPKEGEVEDLPKTTLLADVVTAQVVPADNTVDLANWAFGGSPALLRSKAQKDTSPPQGKFHVRSTCASLPLGLCRYLLICCALAVVARYRYI